MYHYTTDNEDVVLCLLQYPSLFFLLLDLGSFGYSYYDRFGRSLFSSLVPYFAYLGWGSFGRNVKFTLLPVLGLFFRLLPLCTIMWS